jgi:hypothetical protein
MSVFVYSTIPDELDSWNGHERIVEGWRKAVEAAERASADGYWPVHLNGEWVVRVNFK